MQNEFLVLTANVTFVMILSQIVSVIFQKAASGVGIIDPSSETDFVRAIHSVFYVF